MNKLDHIPTELLSLILDHANEKDLYSSTLVNKSFYKEMWRRLDIDSDDTLTKITTVLVTSLHSRGALVREVLAEYWSGGVYRLSETALLALIPHLPLLQHSRLHRAHHITDTSFQLTPRH